MRRAVVAAVLATTACFVLCLLASENDGGFALSDSRLESGAVLQQELSQEPSLDAYGHLTQRKAPRKKTAKKKRESFKHLSMSHMFDDTLDVGTSDPLIQAEDGLHSIASSKKKRAKRSIWSKMRQRQRKKWARRQLVPNERDQKVRARLDKLEAAPRHWRTKEKTAKAKAANKAAKGVPRGALKTDHASTLDMLRTAAHAIHSSSKKKAPTKQAVKAKTPKSAKKPAKKVKKANAGQMLKKVEKELPDGLHPTMPFKGKPPPPMPRKKKVTKKAKKTKKKAKKKAKPVKQITSSEFERMTRISSMHTQHHAKARKKKLGMNRFERLLKHPKSAATSTHFSDDSENGQSMKGFLKREARALKREGHSTPSPQHMLKHQAKEESVQPVVEHLTEATDAAWTATAASEDFSGSTRRRSADRAEPAEHHSGVLSKLEARFGPHHRATPAVHSDTDGGAAVSRMFKLGGHGAFRATEP